MAGSRPRRSASFTFLQLIWVTLLGDYVFAERPEVWIWIGGAVIVGSTSDIARREALARRSRRKR